MLFALITIFLSDLSLIQIYLMLLSTLVILVYYIHMSPYSKISQNRIEIFNESCLYMIIVSFFIFTDYESTYDMKMYLGYSCVLGILLNFLINIILLLIQGIRKLRKWMRKKCKKHKKSQTPIPNTTL
jgi:large-conductance mechanosensitive channel